MDFIIKKNFLVEEGEIALKISLTSQQLGEKENAEDLRKKSATSEG